MDAKSVLPMLCMGGTAASMILIAVVLPIVIVTVQILALKDVGKDFPYSMWTFEMNPGYTDACHRIFRVMNWTVIMCFVGLFFAIIHFCVSACTFQQEGSKTSQGCSLCAINLVRIAQSIVAICGAFVTWGTTTDDCSECMYLYNVAWWCYLGIPLIAFVLGCCILPVIWCGLLSTVSAPIRPDPPGGSGMVLAPPGYVRGNNLIAVPGGRLDMDLLLSAPRTEAQLQNMHPGVLQADLQRFQRVPLVQP